MPIRNNIPLKRNTTVIDTNVESDYFVSFKDTNNPNNNNTILDSHMGPNNSNQNASNVLRYMTPELSNRVDEKQCKEINKDMMRAMINKKMRKNKTFYELKVLLKDSDNGQSNHELEQQVVK